MTKKSDLENIEDLPLDDVDIFTNSIVPQTDDPGMPQFTFRVFFLGTFWCVLFAFANTVLSFRTNTFAYSLLTAVLTLRYVSC